MPTTYLMQPASTPVTSAGSAYQCRFCEQPIARGTGVTAAPRLAPNTHQSGSQLQAFGTLERYHALCVPASYRLSERF
jgi:hypothetical protein